MGNLRRTWIGAATVGGAAAVVGGFACGAAIGLARTAARVEERHARPVKVMRIVTGTNLKVWLRGSGVDGAGRQSLLFEAPGSTHRGESRGHARLGPVLTRRRGEVLREVVTVDRGELVAGATGRMVGWWFTGPEELGFRVEKTSVAGELGPMDAWIVHPRRRKKRRWAIHVHGRGASPAETLRGIAPLARAGVTSMVITYRNDAGQPAGRNRRYGFGVSEASDLEAAILEAVSRGAERVTLIGWSMGGTMSLLAAVKPSVRNYVDGLVLDSPGVDWPGILRAHTAARGLPRPITDLGIALLSNGLVASGAQGGVRIRELTPEVFARNLTVPTLVLAGPGDTFVPWDGARALAALRPELVELKAIRGAGHVRLWNADPEAWERAVFDFVSYLPKPAWRGQ